MPDSRFDSRPHRQSIFTNPGWPPKPDCPPPSPSALRLAQPIPRAQQIQARALAAQAAHQQRVSAAAVHVINPDDTPTPALAYPSLNNPTPPDNSSKFTSPTASVDISAFLPAPGPPVLIANEATIAASAVPLSTWAAELVWLILNRRYQSSSDAWLRDRSSLIDNTLLDPLKAFVNQTLSATLASPQGLILGLYFVSKLPIGSLQPAAKLNSEAPLAAHALFASLGALSPAELEFRDILLPSGPPTTMTAQLVFVLSLMLSNKWLEDNTFTTKTWHDVTGLPQAQLKNMETAALRLFNFSLFVRDQQWLGFLQLLRSYTSNLVGKEPIGETSSVNRFALGRIDDLLILAQESKASAGRSGSQIESIGDQPLLTPGSPLCEDSRDSEPQLPPYRQERHMRSASFPAVTTFAAPWDMRLDSPLNRSYHHHVKYEAVQRPAEHYPLHPYPLLQPSHIPPPMYMHSNTIHKQATYAPTQHAAFPRPWCPSQAPTTFNAPHPGHLNMSRPEINPGIHASRFTTGHHMVNPEFEYPGQFQVSAHLSFPRPLDIVEPGWVSQLGFAAQAFVAGSGARIRT